MSCTLPLLTMALLLLSLLASAACGGGEEKATQTATGSSGATPTQAAAGIPSGLEFSSSAAASVKVGDKTLTFENGTCANGSGEAWLAVSMGQVSSTEYFLLIVGNTTGKEGARLAKGGGVFTDGEIAVVTGEQSGTIFAMLRSEQDKVTVAGDLKSGEFVGTSTDGEPMSGSFKC